MAGLEETLAALALDADSSAASLGLAKLERHAGNREAEFALLASVLERDPSHPAAHARLAALTGPAPRQASASFDARVERALRHPYDPWALVQAGRVLADGGRSAEAIVYLEKAVWLTDLDPVSGLDALRLLAQLDARWGRRRIVPVQLHADELVRASPGWRFRLRTVWLSASNSLNEVLATRFVPISIQAFETAAVANDLDAIHAALLAGAAPPAEGIVAGITGRPVPSGFGVYKKGVAEFLGRSLVVRFDLEATQSRVLAHEILHLYGAIHVAPEVDSLMNPTGDSLVLDAQSIRLVRSLRERGFARGGIETNVMARVDLGETVDAYIAALGVNLGFREAGIADAREASRVSRHWALSRAEQATQLDPQLADAARIVAVLMLADARRVEALALLELASRLYGAMTPRGRETAQRADRLRSALAENLLDDPTGRAPSRH